MAAIEVEYMNASDSGRDYGRIILIQKEEDVIIVLFYSISQDGYEIFEKVLESIKSGT